MKNQNPHIMNMSKEKVRAIGLCSGGLDSILSGLLLKKQGIRVEWITFETPFFSSIKAKKASDLCGIPIIVKKITPRYMEMLRHPPAGYGKHMNPCMDCHTLMFQLAGEIMKEKGFDFLFSGEVLGQRPMSQTGPSLRYVEKNSGFDGLILRPLSAKQLPVTVPEKKGLVNRDLLLKFSGRSRKPQIALAQEFGIKDYPTPAGGCLLTDKNYSIRLKDFFEHMDDISETMLELLKYGRHFRLDKNTKIIVGRSQKDNESIMKHHNPCVDTVINVLNFPGPVVLMHGDGCMESTMLAATICASYSKAPNDMAVDVKIEAPKEQKTFNVLSVPSKTFRKFML